MAHTQFLPKSYFSKALEGSITCAAPSNIALVKYWGKKDQQLPRNASVSFTLSNCETTTTLNFKPNQKTGADFKVFLEGQREKSFEPKIRTFFERIENYVPFIKDHSFEIRTSNSFPHSSGIASSASGMAALAMCLIELEKQLSSHIENTEFWSQKASFLARLGSGSASRSIEGPLVIWGEHETYANSSDLFGVTYPEPVHEVFQQYQDTILLVDKGEKQVSSTIGHNLMNDHPYAEQRFLKANDNLAKLKDIFAKGDLESFIEIVESEALQLHAMMMSSMPYFILMKPATLEIIERIWKYRKETGSHACFTLDAGANVHLLYPHKEKE
ncbi:MAG: diphosphomevalonate decarboxylase, partial [Flavobacteriaceae bacterium]|nr:diphosphomevalonate decarboxylase [Flavobacteriaceae bacterium]